MTCFRTLHCNEQLCKIYNENKIVAEVQENIFLKSFLFFAIVDGFYAFKVKVSKQKFKE